MRPLGVVLRKEVIDNLRDRRSFVSAMLFALLGPLLFFGVLHLVGRADKAREGVLEVPVIGAERAPGLVEQLEQQRIRVASSDLDPRGLRAAVLAGDHPVALIVHEGYAEDFQSNRPALVQLVLDSSNNTAQPAVERVSRIVATYGAVVGRIRLLARGIDPSIVDAIDLAVSDVSTPEATAATIFGMLPYLLILAIFVSGYYVVIDSTAGEIERGSLEPLLLNPVSRFELLAAKMLAGVCFSLAGLVLAAVGFWAVPQLARSDWIGTFRLPGSTMIQAILLLLPMVVLATGVGMVISTLCRGFKQAQTTLSIVSLVPMVPGILLSVSPFKPELWMMMVPMLSEQILLRSLLRGDSIEPTRLVISMVSTVAASIGALALSAWLFSGERPFGGRLRVPKGPARAKAGGS